MICRIATYVDEEGIPIIPHDKVMLIFTEPGGIPDHCLDDIPKEAAHVIRKVFNKCAGASPMRDKETGE